jgi:hypothetical protein
VNVWSEGEFLVLDQGYDVVDTWTIGNGYGADVHDLQLLDNGHALLFSYTPIPADLSPYGGPVDGIVIDTVVQEQDSQKNVVFEWHGSDHVPLTDAYVPLDVSPVDFMHTNAIELDQDGNLLISSRSLSAITKIDRQTGDVIWRMGGRSSQFTFTNDPGFSFQHDVRRLDNGHLTVFDNGNAHSPPHSRAVEYRVNEAARTATRVWRYPDDTSLFAPYMGNFQRLDNGNSMMGWGALPQVTEVLPNGDVAFEVRLSHLTYRAFRFPWTGLPATPPSAVALATGDPTMATLYFSWNGATDIDGFQVFAGPTPQQMTLVTTADRTGFESSVQLSGLDPATCVFQVRPIHHQGLETPYSNFTYRLEQPACLDLLTPVYLPLVPQ